MRSDPTSVEVVEEPEQDETGFRDDEEEAVDEDEEDEEDDDDEDAESGEGGFAFEEVEVEA